MSQFRNFHVISQLVVIKDKFLKFHKTVEAIKCSVERKTKQSFTLKYKIQTEVEGLHRKRP